MINPVDLDKVKLIQGGYKVEPLSAFTGKPAPGRCPSPTGLSR